MDFNRTTRHGLTLLELLLALAGTALVGAALALMLSAVTYASSQGTDIRSLVARNHALKNRLDATLRSARQVLVSGKDDQTDNVYLILWMAEPEAKDNPRISQVRRFEFDPNAKTIHFYKFDQNDDAQTSASTAKTDTDQRISDNQYTRALWATNITALAFDKNTDNKHTLVSYRITMQAGQLTDTAIGAASLRN